MSKKTHYAFFRSMMAKLDNELAREAEEKKSRKEKRQKKEGEENNG